MSSTPPHHFQHIPQDAGHPLVPGILCKVASESTGGAYTILELSLAPQGGAPLHTHQREDEIFYIVEGVCEIVCGEQRYLAEAGAIVVLPKGTPHSFRNTGTSHNRILITAIPGGLDEYFTELSQISKEDPHAPQKVEAINAHYAIQF